MFINKVSPSKIRCYNECKQKYKFKYVDYIPEEYNPNSNKDALQFGSYIHKVLEYGTEVESYEELKELSEKILEESDFVFGPEKAKLTEPCLRNFFEFNKKLEETISNEMVQEKSVHR